MQFQLSALRQLFLACSCTCTTSPGTFVSIYLDLVHFGELSIVCCAALELFRINFEYIFFGGGGGYTKVRLKRFPMMYWSSTWHCRQRKIICGLIMCFVADTDKIVLELIFRCRCRYSCSLQFRGSAHSRHSRYKLFGIIYIS